ncbi:polymer-forming cytoskeletal protein [bacterium]|nr:polymer-forming cytoskeletal protein [bacterium]
MELNQKDLKYVKKLNTTVVFEGIKMKGDVTGTHNYYLAGEFEGTLDLTALLIVGKTGKFSGTAKVNDAVIEGEFEGKLTASGKVDINDSGHFSGEILTPSVKVSDQAYFEGKVSMAREGENKRVIDMNAASM